MINEIIDDINKNISEALNKSLDPLVKQIIESDKNINILNDILYNLPLYKDLEVKYINLKKEYDENIEQYIIKNIKNFKTQLI